MPCGNAPQLDCGALLEEAGTHVRLRAPGEEPAELMQEQKNGPGLNAGSRGQLRGKVASGGSHIDLPEDCHPTLAAAKGADLVGRPRVAANGASFAIALKRVRAAAIQSWINGERPPTEHARRLADMVQAKTSSSHLGGGPGCMRPCSAIGPARLETTPQPGCKVIGDESLRAPQSWRGSYRFLVECEEFFGWDPGNQSRQAGDSDPEPWPYIAREIDCALLV
jgi:hypothetical protein